MSTWPLHVRSLFVSLSAYVALATGLLCPALQSGPSLGAFLTSDLHYSNHYDNYAKCISLLILDTQNTISLETHPLSPTNGNFDRTTIEQTTSCHKLSVATDQAYLERKECETSNKRRISMTTIPTDCGIRGMCVDGGQNYWISTTVTSNFLFSFSSESWLPLPAKHLLTLRCTPLLPGVEQMVTVHMENTTHRR